MSEPPLCMTAPPEAYRERRRRLAADLERPLVIFAGRAQPRHYETNVQAFRAGSNYLYFGGPPVEGSALLIRPGSDGDDGCMLFRTPSTFEDAVWIGAAPDDEVLAAAAGLSTVALAAPADLADHIEGLKTAYLAPPNIGTMAWTNSLNLQPANEQEQRLIVAMRLIKDEHEIKALRRAADISVDAHLAAMKAAAPGKKEAEVTAAIMQVLTANFGIPSFTPIVSVRGEVLHSETYFNTLQAGDLLLVDAGAEALGGYAGDITRTYPVDGKWSDIQRHLYDTVLRAEEEAIKACLPGWRYRDIHDLAAKVICDGLVEAELLKGDPATLAGRNAHTLFFTHGLGHLLGLDVHDMEDFGDLAGYAEGRDRRPEFGNKFLRFDRDLAPGMSFTIEPGLYLVPAIWALPSLTGPFEDVLNRSKIEALVGDQFGGVRIEDDVVVRADGEPEVLTRRLPRQADDVAAIIGG